MYKKILRPIFFSQDPEDVHDRMTLLGQFLGGYKLCRFIIRLCFGYKNRTLNQKLWGISFENPVGLAAGFDKDGKLFGVMGSVGFGFSEVGTVTYKPYEGNPKPRLYRLPKSEGLVVYYGLKNMGARGVIRSLKAKNKDIPLVISVGRTNSAETVLFENGVQDFYNCLKEFINAGVGDAYEINISCPNTFGGEPFADPISLEKLLQKIYSLEIKKPVFLKMPLNLEWLEFKKLVDIALSFKVDALVIANLNKDRTDPSIKENIPSHIRGNVSGKPTKNMSNDLILKTYKYCSDKIKIIGVGGIFSAEDAYEKIRRGASLVELITGMIYEGPQLVGEINRGIADLLKRDGYKNISEAVGTI